MREPLLDIQIPDSVASPGDHYLAADPGEAKILLVLQVYDNARSQENVREVCAASAREAGVRLIAVENAAAQLAPDPSLKSVESILPVKEVSAGVLSLLNTGDVPIEVWGVDDMEAIKRSYEAMATVRSLLGTRDRVFAALRPWLRRGQEKLYPKALARALAGELSMYADNIPLTQRAMALKEAAAGLRLELKDFPALHRFLEIADIEKTIDAGRARQQTAAFIERLTTRLHSWHTVVGKNQVNLDLEKAAPIVEYWLEMTGQSAAEFEQKFRSGGAEPVFLALKQWIDSWLIEKAVRQGAGGPAAVHEELIRLALRLDVPFFELVDFRKSVAAQRDIGALKVTLPDEISEASRWLAGRMESPEAKAFWEAERELDVMFRALGLAVPPAEAESADISPARFTALLEDMSSRIGQAPPPGVMSEVRVLGPGLDAAGDFLRLSRSRSRHMVEHVLELMRAASADRIVLVIGGFHKRAIVRELEDHREISWSVIVPSIEMPTGSRAFGSFWT
jgi:hypothetical protein